MTDTTLSPAFAAAGPATRVRGYWRTVGHRLRYDYVTLFFFAVVALIVAAAIAAPLIAPFDPNKTSMAFRLKPIGFRDFRLGTDELGRDMLSRLIWGGRMSLLMGLVPVVIATTIGGTLGVVAGFEALRRCNDTTPPVTLAVVDFADEEGARFSRSLLGSSAAAGSLIPDSVRGLVDRHGVRLAEALAENGVDLDRMPEAHRALHDRHPRAYLELHIEQGPVLETLGRSTGVVIGTYGVERHLLRFAGQAAHSGSTPIAMRRDAFLAAAETALACREIARRREMVCTVGTVAVEPGIVTAIPGVCEISLDQRAFDADTLSRALADAHEAAAQAAAANGVTVTWRRLWRIDPCRFDPRLVDLCVEAVREATGHAPQLPSGPLHDAVEMARVMPAVMMFARSTNGLSHCKEEDTPEVDLRVTIDAFLRLVDKTVAAVAAHS